MKLTLSEESTDLSDNMFHCTKRVWEAPWPFQHHNMVWGGHQYIQSVTFLVISDFRKHV